MSDGLSTFPFDLAGLSKGDWIAPERCEEVTGVKRDDRRYPLRLLAIREQLERLWQNERGEVITTRCEKDGIRICSDDAACETNDVRSNGRWRGLVKDQYRRLGIDRARLSSDAVRARHERSCVVNGARIAGAETAVKALPPKPHRRSTPLIDDKK